MKKYISIFILCLIACQDNNMQCTQQGVISSIASQYTDTTPDGEQVFGGLGDSNWDGRGATIPVVASGTLYLSDGSTITEITTQSVANDDNTKGSIIQQFATDYKGLTGYKTVYVNGGSGGSEFYPNGDNNNWYTSGTLYAAWKSKLDNTLSLLSLSRPKAIFLNLGINDLRSANVIADIRTGIDSLFSRLLADYPGVPILVIQMGREEGSNSNSQKAYEIRTYLIDKAEDNADVHIVSSAGSFIDVSGGYLGDNLHYSQTTNNTIGSQIARWYENSDISNKWARSVVTAHHDALSANRKTLISDFITNAYADGNYFKLEWLTLFKTTIQDNTLFDFTFKSYGVKISSPGFTANSEMTTNGSSSSFAVGYTNSIYTAGGAGQDDFIVGVKLKTRTTASGTAAILFSRFDAGGNGIRVGQSTTAVNYHGNVLAASQKNYATETAMANNTLYSVARNGGTMYLLKGSSVVDSSVQASSGACGDAINIGRNNNNGTAGFYLNASYEYAFAAKYSDLDLASFYTDIEYVLAHWND